MPNHSNDKERNLDKSIRPKELTTPPRGLEIKNTIAEQKALRPAFYAANQIHLSELFNSLRPLPFNPNKADYVRLRDKTPTPHVNLRFVCKAGFANIIGKLLTPPINVHYFRWSDEPSLTTTPSTVDRAIRIVWLDLLGKRKSKVEKENTSDTRISELANLNRVIGEIKRQLWMNNEELELLNKSNGGLEELRSETESETTIPESSPNTPPKERTKKLNEWNHWLYEIWKKEGKPMSAQFHRILHKYVNTERSPLIARDHATLSLTFKTTQMKEEKTWTKKALQNKISEFKGL